MPTRTTLRTATAALCLVLALGACGGGDDTDTNATTGDDTTEAASTGTGGSSGGTDFTGKGSEDFCKFVQSVDKNEFGGNFMESEDPKDMKADYEKAKKVYSDALKKAPSEIKADMQTMQKAITSLGDLLAKYDFDFEKLGAAMASDPKVATQMESLSSADFEAATDRVDDYFKQVCGVDVDE